MKSFLTTLGLGLSLTISSFGQTAKHVVLISIDGFRPDFYREAKWPTPNLQHMAAQGTSADGVRGVLADSIAFEPAFPEGIYHREAQPPRDKRRFFFYARPNNDRNLFLRGVEAVAAAIDLIGSAVDRSIAPAASSRTRSRNCIGVSRIAARNCRAKVARLIPARVASVLRS